MLAELLQALCDTPTMISVHLCAQSQCCSQGEVHYGEALPETPWTQSMFDFELIFGYGLSETIDYCQAFITPHI